MEWTDEQRLHVIRCMTGNFHQTKGHANRNDLYDINSVASWSPEMLRQNEDYFLGLLTEAQINFVKGA